jgi:hypothetical protein
MIKSAFFTVNALFLMPAIVFIDSRVYTIIMCIFNIFRVKNSPFSRLSFLPRRYALRFKLPARFLMKGDL